MGSLQFPLLFVHVPGEQSVPLWSHQQVPGSDELVPYGASWWGLLPQWQTPEVLVLLWVLLQWEYW